MQATRLLTVLLVSFLFPATASAQVFDDGPSDPALFTTIFNVPGDVLPQLIGNNGIPTQVNVASGGSVGDDVTASGVEVNISGGSVGDGFGAARGSEVNISGGTVGNNFGAFVNGGVVNISGGSVGDGFFARIGSTVNLLGSDFMLDGVLLNGLVPGEAFTIVDRDVTLSGVLEDGSAFSFDLNTDFNNLQDTFEPGSTLTVTLTSALLGDCNLDDVVNFLDIPSFISILSVGDYLAEADINEDGMVTFLDIGPFIELLSAVEPPAGIVRVRLEPVAGIFDEGFEIGLRFETADGTVIASTLWTDFVREKNGNPTINDFYECVLEQSVPPGDIVLWAEANVGIGPPPVTPDLAGPLRCRLDVSVPEGGQIDVEVLFFDQNCLRLP